MANDIISYGIMSNDIISYGIMSNDIIFNIFIMPNGIVANDKCVKWATLYSFHDSASDGIMALCQMTLCLIFS